ncbi:GNAT family N-acetyltransferase [Streptococcus gallolyticus]|nr:GNAT family N-acetyltransferase [Streptococcus gallolyticus]MBY5040098.1 GNAT family N-acetyltransferase [Streptococcus gallolyticus]
MIRRASQTDIPVLIHFLQQILLVHHQVRPDIFKAKGQKFSFEELEKLVLDDQRPIFVYEKEGQILGHLFCQIKEADSNVLELIKTLFIDDLCVDESARGQAIGQKLMDFAKEYAKELSCHNLTLDVWNDNAGAARFYERLGMSAQKTRLEMMLED